MKPSNISKFVSSGVLTLGMALMPLIMPASAQTDTTGTTGTTGTTTTTTTQGTDSVGTGDRDFDWGWLGLLGLGGLAGLAGNKRSEPTAYRDPDTVGTTGYREP
jgi:MYXO-CTERM domain-containing protein